MFTAKAYLTSLFIVFVLVGCVHPGDTRKNTKGKVQSFEMVDKTQFDYSGSDDEFLMHWDRIDEHCMGRVRHTGETVGFQSEAHIYAIYRNCMSANNFRLIGENSVQSVIDRNNQKYGFSYIITKEWPR